ncbi:kinesin-like protein KIN-5C [Hibiscus syriacus]|uniref:kinesin-like protein KIN-5C n=1 Tax=Hibiscus syriacus TaxID=106335 RepID=UPI001922DB06|nr:kinesin-like protein KIN-5C [Hibiscus syriacus]
MLVGCLEPTTVACDRENRACWRGVEHGESSGMQRSAENHELGLLCSGPWGLVQLGCVLCDGFIAIPVAFSDRSHSYFNVVYINELMSDPMMLYFIGREEKLNTDNRVVVNNFQAELSQQIGTLRNLVASSVSQQNEHLRSVEKLCYLGNEEKGDCCKSFACFPHGGIPNVVGLHKASSNAALDKISSLASSNAHYIEEDQFFSSEASKAASMFGDLQRSLAIHQGEMTVFAKELRQRFHVSIEQTKDISDYASEILDKLSEEFVRVQNHAVQADEVQMKSISSFQKAYEEQSKSDAAKPIADMTNLVHNHVRRQKELVDARLFVIKESAVVNKTFLDGHVSSMEGITTDAKRKWQAFAMQVENDAKDTADLSAAKHCCIEELVQHCMSTAESAFEHYKSTQESANEMGSKHVSDMESLIRNTTYSNEQHDAEIDSARVAAEQDGLKKTDDTLQYIDGMSEQEQGITRGIMDSVKAHGKSLETFQDNHSSQASSIKQRAEETFQQRYMVPHHR